ncbi:MAG: FIST C-terminal domain-containing protein [Bacteroidales bacterium]|nr:FIST C-terminal domain-containing protein [Bacteroidales bacterium]
MIIHFIEPKKSENAFEEAITSLENNSKIKSILILACENDQHNAESVNSILRQCKLPVFGAIFPQIIYKNKNYSEGTLIVGIEHDVKTSIIHNLSDSNLVFEDILEVAPFEQECKTVFLFVDAFAKRIPAFIEGFFNIYGLEFNVIGAGAGFMDMIQKPCIFTNEGLLEDAAIIVGVDVESGVGVKHGWKDLRGPFKASASEKNTLFTLGEESAFSLYKRIILEDSGKEITVENFFEMAYAYPFGISRLGVEKIVRDPFRVNPDGSIFFLGDIPQGVYLHVLKGDKESLVKAASDALHEAEKNMVSENENRSILFIDCISRVLFLKEDYQCELNAIYNPKMPMIGALTLGEIANNKKEYLEFYNKTAVVSIIENL